ncbi:Inorganic pyrophosphatase [Metarhizium album ARSEF 1941]|uniref:inorganic diphosphatase n=1 Tax=Metarhizium album (strain ARSEF 1941) TaxID=1081103 RepID=A0A0B2X4B9_METAS|nr:Inorganic pyrophosphatase [Metarhizium album ARSEF 1941]KHO00608.1 Inorganic pyrophosphatase [Metarhizium album ARSEF 1941]
MASPASRSMHVRVKKPTFFPAAALIVLCLCCTQSRTSVQLLRMRVLEPLQAALVSLSAIRVAAQNNGSYTLREVGARNTIDWRVWLERDGSPISPWHDVPLYPDNKPGPVVNFVVEIPRWTDGKVETRRDEPLNPFFHDSRKNEPRFVESIWPHKSYPFAYGSIPQTWENKNVRDNYTGFVGDNDPVDLLDISSISPGYTGQVKQVKVLGGLAMIDDNTTDWKVIGVGVEDPLADRVNSIKDVETYRPGLIKALLYWITASQALSPPSPALGPRPRLSAQARRRVRSQLTPAGQYYKVVGGKGPNTIAGNDYVEARIMIAKIAESHGHWGDLLLGKEERGEISIWQTTDPRACGTYVKPGDATRRFGIPRKSKILPPAPRPAQYDRWYYLNESLSLITVPGDVVGV